jgi:tetratricopeptide (TPR) repeat protein
MQATETSVSWLDIPEDVKYLLMKASDCWENTTESQKYVNEALKKSEDNLDVLVGAYRYFFYQSNVLMALQIAEKVIHKIEQDENLPQDWEQLQLILASRKYEPKIRLYLNAYASTGLILAKLGNIEAAKVVTQRVKEIDEKRESCATTVFEVLTSPPEDEDYED